MNIGNCDLANTGEIFEIAEGETLKCPKCGSDMLIEVSEGISKKLIGIIAGVVLILAIIGCIIAFTGNPKVEKLSIDKTSVTFRPGQTERLNVTVEPKDVKAEFVWQSSDENVVSVLDGVLTGQNAGKASIKVFVKDQEDVSAVCECIVVENDVDMQTLDIVEDPLVLRPGGHQQLTVNYTPEDQNETISWSSTDETVATVSPRGKVDAIKVGQAFIIAKSDRTGVADTASVSVEGPAEMPADNTSETKAPANKPAVTPTTKPTATPTAKPTATQAPKPTAQTKPAATPSPKPATASASGSKNLGYATFKGSWPNDVNGRMVFKTSHIIDSKDPKKRVAEAGDYVIGEWSEGHLVQGIWYGANNTVKGSVIIGK